MPNNAPTTSKDSVTFEMGPPKRPPIKPDTGFLTLPLGGAALPIVNLPFLVAKQAAWTVAEAWNAYQQRLNQNVPDGMAAYQHYLCGYGRAREFSYEKYISDDEAGKITLTNAVDATMAAAENAFRVHFSNKTISGIKFSLTSSSIRCGEGDTAYPYPRTANWRFAIGAHFIWLSADIEVKKTPTLPDFTMAVVLHAEDRYNFNPGQATIDTIFGIRVPDAVHGYLFEKTKYATPYTHFATLKRTVCWSYGIKASIRIQQ